MFTRPGSAAPILENPGDLPISMGFLPPGWEIVSTVGRMAAVNLQLGGLGCAAQWFRTHI
jgi:hypothetical protein